MIQKIKLTKVNSTLDETYDVFICAASFEDRCLSVASKIKRKKISKVIVLENKNKSELISEKSNILHDIFGNKTEVIAIDFDNPLQIADSIVKNINGLPTKCLNVLIDITSFTHEVLLICLKLLYNNKRIKCFTCVYTNASEYCPDQPLEKKWLSKGAGEIHSVLGYSGMLLPSMKTHLIIIVGYEYDRAFNLLSSIEPSSVTLVYGSSDSAMTTKDKDANIFYKNLLESLAFEHSNIDSIQIPCDNPIDTAKILTELYENHSCDNIIIVPMNSKMSTLGLFLSTIENEFVQVCYAPAVFYNEKNYSVPGEFCHILKLR